MNRIDLIKKVKKRKTVIGITINNIAKLTNLDNRIVSRFFADGNVELNTIEKIAKLLGLDLAGNEIIDIKALKKQRAREKALYIVSLVQDTSILERQGLNHIELEILIQETQEQFLNGEYQKYLWVD